MSETRYCRQCGTPFTAKRADHWFCCAAHVAAYYRDNPNPDFIHAEKEHIHAHYCEQCGAPFSVNDYAQRGGARAPKYCSPKCKQAAYRARGQGTQEQAKRRYTGSQQSNTSGARRGAGNTKGAGTGQNAGNANSGRSSAKNGSGGQSDFWKGFPTKWAAAESIMGVSGKQDKRVLRGIWMKLIKQYHPDVNPAPDATLMCQKINWAYEYLSK